MNSKQHEEMNAAMSALPCATLRSLNDEQLDLLRECTVLSVARHVARKHPPAVTAKKVADALASLRCCLNDEIIRRRHIGRVDVLDPADIDN